MSDDFKLVMMDPTLKFDVPLTLRIFALTYFAYRVQANSSGSDQVACESHAARVE